MIYKRKEMNKKGVSRQCEAPFLFIKVPYPLMQEIFNILSAFHTHALPVFSPTGYSNAVKGVLATLYKII